MKPQSCKAKGRRLQQMIVADLLEMHPQLSEDDVKSTSMGAGGEDVQLSAAARTVVPYSFEAKNQEKLNVWSAMAQAKANTPAGTDPVVVFKKNNEKPHVMITWELFKNLISPSDDSAKTQMREEMYRMAKLLQDMAATI